MKKMRNSIGGLILCAMLTPGAALLAQQPVQNVNAQKHASMASAQASIAQAYEKLKTAQRYHHDQLAGHAQKAMDLLAQASQEIKMAADSLDQHHK